MTPTNTQGSEQSLEDKIIAERWSVPVGADDSVDVITVDRVLALIKSDREAVRDARIEEREYTWDLVNDVRYQNISLDEAKRRALNRLSALQAEKEIAQLSKEDSNHA